MTTETTTARTEIAQLTDSEIDAVGGAIIQGGWVIYPDLGKIIYNIGRHFRWW
jgi:hypothetical protein